jgi:hypothetical protein
MTTVVSWDWLPSPVKGQCDASSMKDPAGGAVTIQILVKNISWHDDVYHNFAESLEFLAVGEDGVLQSPRSRTPLASSKQDPLSFAPATDLLW